MNKPELLKLSEKVRQSLGVIKKLRSEVNELTAFHGPIAVIGMACHFPGDVNSPKEYWKLLMNQGNGIDAIPAERWKKDLCQRFKDVPWYGGFIKNVDKFDAQFFGISTPEAEAMDPQQRLLLKTTYEALENAGLPLHSVKGTKAGVFIGLAASDYMHKRAATSSYDHLSPYDITGNTNSNASGRISYAFDLKGPNLAIDTACSSSLVAVHLACNSLRSGESDMVVAGGANVILNPNAHVIFSRMQALSPEGKCKTFDASADGFVRSEGCGIVILKRLKDAIRVNDPVLALIHGTAINQDGRSNGLTAPNGLAQVDVLKRALHNSKLEPEQIAYIEAHGTGTPLGDPIEAEAINQVFDTPLRTTPLYLGSVKTNIGHLESAAGIASLIKAILAVQNKTIPPNLHFHKPNQYILWKDFVKVPQQEVKCEQLNPMTAGVSAFGFSGTNAHVIVSSYQDDRQPDAGVGNISILTLSAKSEASLRALSGKYAERLADEPDISVSDLCYTAAVGRSHYPFRASVVPSDLSETIRDLATLASGRKDSKGLVQVVRACPNPSVAFLFTGQGSQYAGMGKELYQTQPVFKQAIDQCASILNKFLDKPLIQLLFSNLGTKGQPLIDQTVYTQPCLFSIEYALCALWNHWGVQPSFVIGHSIGEYVAACIAGVFSLHDGLFLVTQRATLMDHHALPGGMISVRSNIKQVEEYIAGFDKISIAAVNSLDDVVISGEELQLKELVNMFKSAGIPAQRLTVSHAFHSPQMRPVQEAFEKVALSVKYNRPSVAIVSNLTGEFVTEEIAHASYWVEHITAPVLFQSGIERLRSKVTAMVEVGPNPILTNLTKKVFAQQPSVYAPSMLKNANETLVMTQSVGKLYTHGIACNWAAILRGSRKISIPTYCFDEQTFWISSTTKLSKYSFSKGHRLLGDRISVAGHNESYVWSKRIDLSVLPFLYDHQVNHRIIFPAACYIEMVQAAARQIFHCNSLEMYSISFERVLIIQPDKQYDLQVKAKRLSKEEFIFSVFNREVSLDDNRAWILGMKATARIHSLAVASDTLDINRIQERCNIELEGSEFYKSWNNVGNNWGPAFKGLEKIWIGENEMLSLQTAPDKIRDDFTGFDTHPAFLDICGQLLVAGLNDKRQKPFVGKSVKHVNVFSTLHNYQYWSHATLIKSEDDSRIQGNIGIYDAEGKIVAQTLGVTFEFLEKELDRTSIEKEWLYRLTWNSFQLPSLQDVQPRSFVIISPPDSFSFGLRDAMLASGHSVKACENFSNLKCHLIDPLESVIYLIPSNVSGHNSRDSSDELIRHMLCIRDIIHELKNITFQKIGLWLITTDAWGAEEHFSFQSALWGFCRTLAVEEKRNFGGIVDLSSFSRIKCITSVAQILTLSLNEDQFRITANQELLVPRLAHLADISDEKMRLRSNAAYLVAGGLGSVGLAVAKLMVDRGARRIILVGRNGLPDRKKWKAVDPSGMDAKRISAIEEMEGCGACVDIVQLDISNEDEFRKWWISYSSSNKPPVRGIIHAAGVAELCRIEDLDASILESHLAAKVAGTFVLDKYFREDVDFFVLFSSASAVLSSNGLGAYAAGNAYLNGVALKRRAESLPVLCINWGALEDTGIVERYKSSSVFNSYRGPDLIPIETALRILESFWNYSGESITVWPVDWSALSTQYTAYSEMPLVRDLLLSGSNGVPRGKEAFDVPQLQAGSSQIDIENFLKKIISNVLRTDKEMDSELPLTDYGFDSMMAVEIKNIIESAFSTSINIVDLINGVCIRELATRLVKGMPDGHSASDKRPKHVDDSEGKAFSLSYGQMAAWATYLMDTTSAAYNVAFTARITSHVNVEHLKESFQKVIRRQSILRSFFVEAEGQISQMIRDPEDPAALHFEVIDLNHLTEQELKNEVYKTYQRPFDLRKGPLMRVHLFKHGEHYVMLITIHHIVSDGWSLWLLLQEVGKNYSKTPGLTKPLAFTYIDFIRWQNAMLEGKEGHRLWMYWRALFPDHIPVLNLPVTRPRFATTKGETYTFDVNESVSAGLRDLSKQESTTIFVTTLTVFKILLFRYTGQKTLIVGSPTSGRTTTEFQETIGNFINLVPIRSMISPNDTCRSLMRQVRETVLGAVAHQDYPFSLLVKRLQPRRDDGVTPVFQAVFSFQKPQLSDITANLAKGEDAYLGDLRLSRFEIPQQEGQFDLMLELLEGSGKLLGFIKYKSEIFDVATIRQLARHYLDICKGVVKDPDQSISKLSFLSLKERRNVLQFPKGSPRKGSACIPDLIESVAATSPGHLALLYKDEKMTYAQLNERANQLASFLLSHNVAKGTMIGVCLTRSMDMAVTVLAILKAGCGYVPVDPNYPQGRINFILDDSAVTLVVTETESRSKLGLFSGTIVCLDQEKIVIDRQCKDNIPSRSKPIDIAYIAYTGGPTGRCKGVVIEHRNVTSLLNGVDDFLCTDRVVWLSHSGLLSDTSVVDLLWTLSRGFTLVIAAFDPASDLRQLHAREIARLVMVHKVTHCSATPSVFRLLIENDAFAAVAGQLAKIILTREYLSDSFLMKVSSICKADILNLYGATEATAFSAVVNSRGDRKVIQPIGNTELYVLDDQLNLVPTGVSGTLYIGGDCISRGYHNRNNLTEQIFVLNPIPNRYGKIFNTQDRARYALDGTIELIDRIENVVCVHGFSIEVRQIENVYRSYPGVKECVIVPFKSFDGNFSLAAFLVAEDKFVQVVRANIQHFVNELLPSYMVPSDYHFVKSIPVDYNGRIDHAALLDIDLKDRALKPEYVEPQSEVEKQLAEIWMNILNVARVGVHDNFFQLGGDSITAIKFISKANAEGIGVSMSHLFQCQTIGSLATELVGRKSADNTYSPSLRKGCELPYYCLSFAQKRLWFLDQLFPGKNVYTLFCSLDIDGLLDVGVFSSALDGVIRRHESLRTFFSMIDGEPVQIIADEIKTPIEFHDLSTCVEADQVKFLERLTQSEISKPFELTRAPLFRINICKIADHKYRGVIAFHHIISDGWSIGVFLRDLHGYYNGLITYESVSSEPLPVRYVDFCQFQQEYLKMDGIIASQLKYWTEKLSGISPLTDLPYDRPRPALPSYSGALEEIFLDEQLANKLKEVAAKEDMTLFMVLLTGVALVLSKYSRKPEIVVGSPVANRHPSAVENIIGMFVNTVVMRINMANDPTLRELLASVKESTLEAIRNQDVPFELVVEQLQPERKLNYNPFFQVMFVLQNFPREVPGLVGIHIKAKPIDSGISKFDMTLALENVNNTIVGSVEYSTALFDRETILRMVSNLSTTLDWMVSGNVQSNISQLSLLCDSEPDTLRLSNQFERDGRPSETTLHYHGAHRVSDVRSDMVVFAHTLDNPLNQTERLVLQVFKEILRQSDITVHDNFFLRGGHSLLAARLQHRISKLMARSIPLNAIFEHPVVADLANYLDSHEFTESRIDIAPDAEYYVLSPNQLGIWILSQQDEEASSTYNITARVAIRGDLNYDAFERTVQRLIERHNILQTTFTCINDEPVQILCNPSARLKLEFEDLRGVEGHKSIIEARTHKLNDEIFDLTHGPLVKATLIREEQYLYTFLVSMHHLVSDGWSMMIILRDMRLIYESLLTGRPAPLSPLAIQYNDFASWFKKRNDQQINALAAYWKLRLCDIPRKIELPYDNAHPMNADFRGGEFNTPMPINIIKRVMELSASIGATPFSIYLAIYGAVLYLISKQRTLVVGTSDAGRDHPDTAYMVGFFVHTVPLRMDIDEDNSLLEILASHTKRWSDDFEHKALSFPVLVNNLSTKEWPGNNPVFQVRLLYNDFIDLENEAIAHDGTELTIEPELISSKSKFDLTLYINVGREGVLAKFEYRKALWKEETIMNMARIFFSTATQLLEMPEKKIKDLDLKVIGIDRLQHKHSFQSLLQTKVVGVKDEL